MVIFQSNMNFVKVIQNQFLLQNTIAMLRNTSMTLWRAQPYNRNKAEQSILNVKKPFFCLLSFLKWRKQTDEDGSLFCMTAITYRLKQLHFWANKTSVWWVIHGIVLTWHWMASFYSRTWKTNWEVNVFLTPEEKFVTFSMHILEIPQSEWQTCFNN